MITKQYIISSAHGLHARPATTLIKLVKNYKSDISILKDDKQVRLNSMLNILSLAIKSGETITINIDGEDEAAAQADLDQFFTHQLKEL